MAAQIDIPGYTLVNQIAEGGMRSQVPSSTAT